MLFGASMKNQWVASKVRRQNPPIASVVIRDVDGTAIDWKLQARLQIGEELPPLRTEGKGAQAVTSYL